MMLLHTGRLVFFLSSRWSKTNQKHPGWCQNQYHTLTARYMYNQSERSLEWSNIIANLEEACSNFDGSPLNHLNWTPVLLEHCAGVIWGNQFFHPNLYTIYIYYIHTHLHLQNPAKFPPFARKIGFPKEQPFFAERRFLIVPNNLILQRRHCPTKRRQYPTKRWHYPTTWGDIFFKRRFSAFEFTRTTRNSVFWSNGEKCTTWKM
jgi:hypothetical protein